MQILIKYLKTKFMKKLLLLLTSVMLLATSCSSDDNDNVTYDEVKGYLTDVASVKHGLIGTWIDSTYYASYNYIYELELDGRNFTETEFYITDDTESVIRDVAYYVTLRDGKFYINGLLEIAVLTKTALVIIDEEEDEVFGTYTRKQ